MIAQSRYTDIKELASGRELEILEHVAGISGDLLDRKGHPCPICGGDDRFSLINREEGTVFCRNCFSHGNHGYVNAVIHYGKASDYKEARKMILEHLTGDQASPDDNSYYRRQKPPLVYEWTYLDENGNSAKKITRREPGYNGEKKIIIPSVYYNRKWVTKNSFKNNEAAWKKIYNRVAGLPLNLPGILQRKDSAVFIVEGEKCFNQVNKWGFLATTGSGGTNTTTDWTKYLTGRAVVIFPDNDESGYKYALKTAQSLQGKVLDIRIVFLPDLPEKGDIVDWANAGGTKKFFATKIRP
jgi:hypothetical protein